MLIPLNDERWGGTTAIVVYTLIVINLIIFGYQISLSPWQLEGWFQSWAVIPQLFVADPLRHLITLISSQFLHGSPLHLIGNMWFLYVFGHSLEDWLGSRWFLPFYLGAGVVAALIQVCFSAQSPIPMVGASGAIAGVMGGYLICFPRVRVRSLLWLGFFFTFVRVPAVFYLGLWFAFEAYRAWQSNPNEPGVAYMAHVGGFVLGMAVLALVRWRDRQRDSPP
ncbi:MAG: rhomboid family intramembrane serine protease [Oscillatoriales cyanobacterium SM2_2_1]|nr:rhomboid family intramembrane serine protease [Oscillatoriales cyanobacterium SM2_2_1]